MIYFVVAAAFLVIADWLDGLVAIIEKSHDEVLLTGHLLTRL